MTDTIHAPLRLRVDLSYDGTPFHGWATQPGLVTVQGVIEDSLEKIIRRHVPTVVAGRTDAGVHARRQTIHFDLSRTEYENLTRGRAHLETHSTLVRRLNGVLREYHGPIHVLNAELAPPGFDARFSPTSRSYRYRIADGPHRFSPLTRATTYWHRNKLDENLMQVEAHQLLGLHDFLSFCKPRATGTTIRELQNIEVQRDAEEIVVVDVTADAFCHHMVRAVVGALIKVGERTQPVGWAAARLQTPQRDSQMWLAPAHGLTLEQVSYPADDEVGHRAEQTRAKRQ